MTIFRYCIKMEIQNVLRGDHKDHMNRYTYNVYYITNYFVLVYNGLVY